MSRKEFKGLRSSQADMAGESQGKLQSFFLSCHLELLTRLSHHCTIFQTTSEAAHIFQWKAERQKRVSKLVGFCNTEVPGVPAGAASTVLQMRHHDWQRHLDSCLLCAESHVQAAGGTCSFCLLLASASHPCKGAFSILMLPCSPAVAQPAFFTITKEASLTPQPCWPLYPCLGLDHIYGTGRACLNVTLGSSTTLAHQLSEVTFVYNC